MKTSIKNELENKASRFWNEALLYFKRRSSNPKYGEMVTNMWEAIKYAPTKKSAKFYKNELKRMQGDWNKID